MVEIGEIIARARREKGLQLEEIAEQTRINLKYLQDIEQGNFDFLPRPYVVAYLKIFARLVGLDADGLVKKWREREAALASAEADTVDAAVVPPKIETREFSQPAVASQPSYKPPAPLHVEQQPPPATIPYVKEIAAGLALLTGMALLLYFSTTSSKRDVSPPEPVKEIPFEQVAKETETQQTQSPPTAIVPSEPVKKPMRLEIRAEDRVWVQVVTDKRDSVESMMRAGNFQAWNALEQFYVRMGDAGAVRIILDGKDLGLAGSSGQVGGVLITQEGIKSRRLSRPAPPPVQQQPSSQPDSAAQNNE